MPNPARPRARPRVVADLRLVRLVGEGSEGEVWEARDTRGRRRALKLIRPDALVPPEEVERRGRWLLAIDHPALVAVHRCGVLAGAGLDGWGFVEMTFVDGPALEGAPADPGVLERLAPLAEALDHLHAGTWSQGVPLVHRDVKPANLIEGQDAELVLVDVSTLRDVDDGVRTRIGTPLYAAPEVVTGRAGPLADVYAFAATAVALLSGARRGDLALLLDQPGLIDVPEGLRAALSPDPAGRPVSCRAALDPRLPLIVGREVGWQPVPPASVDLAPAAVESAWADSAEEPWWYQHDEQDAWLPSATEVLLEPWQEPAREGPQPVWPWLVLLGALAGALGWSLPSLAGPASGTGPGGAWIGPAAVAAAHLLACLAAGQNLARAVILPPLAWAALLAERAAPPGVRRSWAGTALLACVCALLVSSMLAGLAPERLEGTDAAVIGGVALALAALVVRVVEAAPLWRVLLAPIWAAGVAVTLIGAAMLLLPCALAGRAGAVLGGVGRALAGAAAFVRR